MATEWAHSPPRLSNQRVQKDASADPLATTTLAVMLGIPKRCRVLHSLGVAWKLINYDPTKSDCEYSCPTMIKHR
jgi:hypothetical protein